MNTPNEGHQPKDNMELLKEQASACGPECGCHAPGGTGSTRWIVVGVVLLAVAVLVGRALMKTDASASQAPSTAPAFALTQFAAEEPRTASVPTASSPKEPASTVTSAAPGAPSAKNV